MAAVVTMAAFSFLMIADQGESEAAIYTTVPATVTIGWEYNSTIFNASHALPVGAAITLTGAPSWLRADNGNGQPVTLSCPNSTYGGVHLTGTPTAAGSWTVNASIAGSTWVYQYSITAEGTSTPEPPPTPTVVKPVASYTYSLDGLKVTFTDTSTNTPTSWAWSFGDGTSSTSKSPTKTYNTAGSYNVSLTASNSAGSTTYTRTITVSSGAPGSTPATVTYDTDGGAAIAAEQTTVGASITLPTASKAGKTFTGWYVGATFVGNAGSSYTVSGNVTLTAHWSDQTVTKYVVTFFGADGRALTSQDVASGGRATEPAIPAGTGTFKGWALSSGILYNFSTPVTANLNLYATFDAPSIWDNQMVIYALIGIVIVLLIVAIARTI